MEDPVTLQCGDCETESFQLERHHVCSASRYLARIFAQKDTRQVIICGTRYEVLGLFCNWVNNSDNAADSNDQSHMQEPWLSSTAAAWLLGERLEAEDFKKFCLGIFIKNCALSPFGSWKDIENYTKAESPLVRFSNHWIAWNVSLLQHIPQECEGLKAVKLAKSVTQHTRDPRDMDQDHWYSSCGNHIGHLCKHHPSARQRNVDETQDSQGPSAVIHELETKQPSKQLAKPSKSDRRSPTQNNHVSLEGSRPQNRSALSHRSSRQTIRSTSPDSIFFNSWYTCGRLIRKTKGYRWGSSLLFATCLCINLGLCIEILVHNYEGVNTLILSFSVVCVALGLFCVCMPQVLPQMGPLYWLCAVVDGVVFVINTASCCKVANASVCSRMGVLTAFVWLSIPISVGQWFLWKKYLPF